MTLDEDGGDEVIGMICIKDPEAESIMGRMEWTVRATPIGTWAAYLVSFCMASLRIEMCIRDRI